MSDVSEKAGIEPGMLLVATPSLTDENFARTVVYIIDHRDSGTLGVVLNRPSEVAVHDVLPSWAPYTSKPHAIFVGGPVEQKTALCVGRVEQNLDVHELDGVIGVNGPIVLIDLDSDADQLAAQLLGMRIFVGYSGWDAGQLDAELDRDDWLVFPAVPDDVLAAPNVDLWARVLRRQGMPTALLATAPVDPTHN